MGISARVVLARCYGVALVTSLVPLDVAGRAAMKLSAPTSSVTQSDTARANPRVIVVATFAVAVLVALLMGGTRCD